MYLLLFIISLFGYGRSLDLPPEFPKCRRSDPGVDNCIKNAFQTVLPFFSKGLSEFGISPSDPILLPSLSIGEGKGVVHVVQNFKNVEIYDILKAIVDSVSTSFTKDDLRISANITFPAINVKADYNLNGRILVLRIYGAGKCKLKLVKPKVPVNILGKAFQRKGKTYIKITNFDINLFPKKVVYDFQNLFNGDPKLGPEMNRILNDNDLDVFLDVKSGYEQAFGVIFMHMANAVFSRVPYDLVVPP